MARMVKESTTIATKSILSFHYFRCYGRKLESIINGSWWKTFSCKEATGHGDHFESYDSQKLSVVMTVFH